jgi:hypothetical protein
MNSTESSESASPSRDTRKAEASTAPSFIATLVLATGLAAGVAPAPFTTPYAFRREAFESDSSPIAAYLTPLPYVDPFLLLRVKNLFNEGAAEFFQDGMESGFSRSLLDLLQTRGANALAAISEYLSTRAAHPQVVAEALRWLADFGGTETLGKRWEILRQGLVNPSPIVRDGAILGFASLDDPRAKAVLQAARSVETVRALQQLLEQVIERLARNR